MVSKCVREEVLYYLGSYHGISWVIIIDLETQVVIIAIAPLPRTRVPIIALSSTIRRVYLLVALLKRQCP